MSYALKKLGHPGLHVTAFDADIVTAANCGRQLFSEQEIGLNKAEALITKLNFFFGTKWESIGEYYKEGSQLANITISCVDTVAARLETHSTSRRLTTGSTWGTSPTGDR